MSSGAADARPETPISPSVVIGLSAVVAAFRDGELAALTVRSSPGSARAAALTGLPSGPFDPAHQRTFELAVREFVTAQTGFDLGYVEQLYTFGDKGRDAPLPSFGPLGSANASRVVSVGYLALTRKASAADPWTPWARYFPWEDWRRGRPALIDEVLEPRLRTWAGADPRRLARAGALFALDGAPWNEEQVLERYELLYEAGLAAEAARDRARAAGRGHDEPPLASPFGEPMLSDHRRILATGLGRLRGKLKYRPILFELLPEAFTLLDAQQAVEAISGVRLHKPNFRRMLERTGLVERLGRYRSETGGRPAELFRFAGARAGSPSGLGISLPLAREAGGAGS